MMAKRRNAHFAAEDWVDYTMQQASPELREAMKKHLETGCEKCANFEQLWSRVARVASRDSSHEPPASAVRHVRNAFAIMAAAESAKRSPIIPRLVFDSLWQPAMAGVRSAHSTPRQILYRAGEISIDLRIEPEPKSERVHISGQISNSARQAEGIAEIQVVVSGYRSVLTSEFTNLFGEFHAVFVPEAGLRVSFYLLGEKELSIPLEGTAARHTSESKFQRFPELS
jgi:hypothetical protein